MEKEKELELVAKTIYETLSKIDITNYIETRNDLNYLSWANAYKLAFEKYPDLTYKVMENSDGVPVFGNNIFGYIVKTEVTIKGVTKTMWLAVTNNSHKTLLDEVYTYQTKSGQKTVEKINMFDINSSIMRCLTKNLAMFGLGLNLYIKDALPTQVDNSSSNSTNSNINKNSISNNSSNNYYGNYKNDNTNTNINSNLIQYPATEFQVKKIRRSLTKDLTEAMILNQYNVSSLEELPKKTASEIITILTGEP